MSIAWLLFLLALIVALLCFWEFRMAPRVGVQRLEAAQRGAMIALHTITALAILSAGVLYLDEQQWTPRLGVELKSDVKLVPDSSPSTAVVQLAISITNKTETSQKVNTIQVAATGIRQATRQDPRQPDEIAGTSIYRHTLSTPIDIGPDETHVAFVEIPIACDWGLVRLNVRVPRPGGGKPAFNYERKDLITTSEVCHPKPEA